MTTTAINPNSAIEEQITTLPGYYDWQQFKVMQTVIEEQPGVRITYLDGVIELMTIGEQHEMIKSMIAILLGIYFWQNGVEFIPVGSATRESEAKAVSFEPDESYYIGEKKEHPDLAVEVNITSGSIRKLEKYKRLQIQEVWRWQNNRFYVYSLEDNEYQEVTKSQLLPALDFDLLTECVLMPSRLEAINKFTQEEK